MDARHDQAVSLLTAGDRQITLVLLREHSLVNQSSSPAPNSPSQPLKFQHFIASQPDEPVRVNEHTIQLEQAPAVQEKLVVQSGPVLQAPPSLNAGSPTTAKLDKSPKMTAPPTAAVKEKKADKKAKASKTAAAVTSADSVVTSPASTTLSKADARSAFFASAAAAASGQTSISATTVTTTTTTTTSLPANGGIEHRPAENNKKVTVQTASVVPNYAAKPKAAPRVTRASSVTTPPEPYSTEVVHSS